MHKIITVSREFGSGGREVGKRLADSLGFAYCDREIVTAVAKNSDLDEQYVENALNRGLLAQFPITFSRTFSHFAAPGSSVTNQLFIEQSRVIRSLAEQGDCVIVGRSADVILAEQHPFRIFVYADLPSKLARCRARAEKGENPSDKELEKQIRQVDKARAAYHGVLSDRAWGDRAAYDLCLNTSGLTIKTLIPSVADYARNWFAQKGE